MLLIDGDVIKYKACLAAQSNHYTIEQHLTQDNITLHLGSGFRINVLKDQFGAFSDVTIGTIPVPKSFEFARYCADKLLTSILEKFPLEPYKLYLTKLGGIPNYRVASATIKPYKGNRKEKPIFYEALSHEMQQWPNTVLVESREADDAMGCEQYKRYCYNNWDPSIICSIDKDMKMIPGKHYNIDTKVITDISLDQADLNFYKQLLVGDEACDNIPHLLKGMGPKKVAKTLKSCKNNWERWEACKKEYEKAKVGDAIYEIANLIWIQRQDSILFKPPREKDYVN